MNEKNKLNAAIHKTIGDLEHLTADEKLFPDDLLGKKSLVEQAILLLEYVVAEPDPVGKVNTKTRWSCSCNFSHAIEDEECYDCGAIRPATTYKDRTVRYLAWKDADPGV